MPAWTKTAGQLLMKRGDFLKDCNILGVDVIYKTMETQGTFDHTTDTYKGSTTTTKSTTYTKSLLVSPIAVTDSSVGDGAKVAGGQKSSMGFSLGYSLGDIDVSTSLVGRLKPNVPLTPTAIYTINGANYKLKRVVENVFLHSQVPLWNVVLLVRA